MNGLEFPLSRAFALLVFLNEALLMWVFKGSRILAEIRDDAVSVGEEAGLSEVGTGRDPSF